MIRRATPQDAPAVSTLVNRAYEHWVPIVGGRPRPMDDDYEVRLAEFESWVDEKDGTVRGVILLEDEGGRLWIDNISVDPDHQGAGIGKALLELSLERGAARGFDEVHLFTHELMDTDRAIYEHLGWVEYSEKAPLADFFVYYRKPVSA